MAETLTDYRERARDYREQGIITESGQVDRGIAYMLDAEAQQVVQDAMACINAEKLTKDGTIRNDGIGGTFEVDQLEGNVAGDYNLGTGRRRIDTDVLADEATARRTIIHENRHAIHYQRNTSGERVADLEWEEALTELGAAKEDGGTPMAYQDYIGRVRGKIARVAGVTEGELVQAYANGEAAKINQVIQAAEGQGEYGGLN